YLVMVLSPGSDGVWGKTGYPRLYNPDNIRDPDTALGEYTLDTRTQEEMLEVIEDMTFLSDDLLWIGMINVQSPFVILNPIAGVGIGEPLEISGTTNREEGYTIVVTAKGPTELTPATVPTTNRTFNATLDTTDARIGTYIVRADDGDGNTDEGLVDIGGAQVEEVKKEIEEGIEDIKDKIGEAIDEKIDEKLPAEPTPEPTAEPTTEPAPEPEATPGFEGVFAIAGLLAIAYLVLKRRK
ncbi:hypothetical protein C5S39_07975, partial [Candidatus Methanophagaceae archaeon]